MWETFKVNVLLPFATRQGSLAAGTLVGWGANQQHADMVSLGIAGAFLIAADLGLAWFRKRAIVNKVRADG